MARVKVDETSDADVTRRPDVAGDVKVASDVLTAPDVEFPGDAATRTHATEDGRVDEDHVTRVAGHVERLVQTEVENDVFCKRNGSDDVIAMMTSAQNSDIDSKKA